MEECFGRENPKVGGKTFGSQGFTIHADDGAKPSDLQGQRPACENQPVTIGLQTRQPLAPLNVIESKPYEVIEIEESPERGESFSAMMNAVQPVWEDPY